MKRYKKILLQSIYANMVAKCKSLMARGQTKANLDNN